MHPLIDFTLSMLNHAANESRVTSAVVQSKLQVVKEHHEDIKSGEVAWSERKNAEEEYPRVAKENAYNEYLQVKKQKYETWQRQRDVASLHDYILFKPPEILFT